MHTQTRVVYVLNLLRVSIGGASHRPPTSYKVETLLLKTVLTLKNGVIA